MLKAKKSFRLQEDKGTRPNVHYVGKYSDARLSVRAVRNWGGRYPPLFWQGTHDVRLRREAHRGARRPVPAAGRLLLPAGARVRRGAGVRFDADGGGRNSTPAWPRWRDALAEAFDAQPLEELQVDYTRLFLNPTGPLAAPYESVWLRGKDPMLVDGGHAVGARQLPARAATRSTEDFRDLPDHIAAELEFLYTLIFREARAAASGNDAERAEAIDLRRRFVELHLGRWVGPFAEALRSGGETALYRTLADLTERFVESERA